MDKQTDKNKIDVQLLGFKMRYSSLDWVIEKLKTLGIDDEKLKHLRGENGGSLLSEAISFGARDGIRYCLSKDIPMNCVTTRGYNEMHLVAENLFYNTNTPEELHFAIEIANELLDRGVDLSVQDKSYGNLPVYSLIYAGALKSPEGVELVKRCIKMNSPVHIKNKNGLDILGWMNDIAEPNVEKEIIQYMKELGILDESGQFTNVGQ
ncbi:MAG TPA: hypothetical protein PLG34_09605 [Spirochaetota bacterium]|jgi:hypothetical protein|nr:MAG: hypothetical protein BWX91_00293 [Spirochaetes bacterium ADurb.Bin133]HNZ26041.1 hypothetical protein [Spirochaetota bacterium]HPY88225.1 hypothetical protein [Spirochaetota bacterium]